MADVQLKLTLWISNRLISDIDLSLKQLPSSLKQKKINDLYARLHSE